MNKLRIILLHIVAIQTDTFIMPLKLQNSTINITALKTKQQAAAIESNLSHKKTKM